MQISGNTFDRTVERVLRVKPVVNTESQERSAENTFMFSMLFTGVRCVLEYILLPFVLPLLNLSTTIALPLVLAANAVALTALLYSIRKFWMIDYKYKRAYLVVGLVGGVILVLFMLSNLGAMLA